MGGYHGMRWHWLLRLYVAGFFAFLYAPIVLLVLLSFNDAQGLGLPFRGFTLRWYHDVVNNPAIIASLINSLMLGACSALASVVLALLLALGFRARFPGKNLLLQMILVPIVVPGIVGGVVLLLSFGYLHIPFGLFTTVFIAHVNWCLPFAFLTLYPRLHRFDHGIEEAARDLGAGNWTIFARIILPIIKPGIIATLLFSFTLSFDEFIRTMFVVGQRETLPIRLWAIVIEQAQPYLPALGVLMMSVTVVASLLGQAFSFKGSNAPGK